MNRVVVEKVNPELWSKAWCAQSCADQQDELASRDLAAWKLGEPHKAFDAYKEMLDRCIDCKSILEVGCGAGYYADVTQHIDPKISFAGMDISAAMISVARRKYAGTFSIAPAENPPTANRSFDLVVLGSVLGHCDDWLKAIEEAFRTSRKWVLVHRLASHTSENFGAVTNTVKSAYDVEMAERIIHEQVFLNECLEFGQLVGEPIRWSQTEEGFQGTYLFEKI